MMLGFATLNPTYNNVRFREAVMTGMGTLRELDPMPEMAVDAQGGTLAVPQDVLE
jgi:hypothetical protein